MLQRFQACESWRSVCRDALSTDFRCSCLLCQGPVLPNCWSSRPFPYRKQTKQHTAWNNSWCKKNAVVTFKQSNLLTVSRNNAILNACIFPNMHFGLAVTFYYHNHIILHMPWSCGCPRHVSAHVRNLSLTGCVGQFARKLIPERQSTNSSVYYVKMILKYQIHKLIFNVYSQQNFIILQIYITRYSLNSSRNGHSRRENMNIRDL